MWDLYNDLHLKNHAVFVGAVAVHVRGKNIVLIVRFINKKFADKFYH